MSDDPTNLEVIEGAVSAGKLMLAMADVLKDETDPAVVMTALSCLVVLQLDIWGVTIKQFTDSLPPLRAVHELRGRPS